MKEPKDKIANGNYLQGYFTQFPNIIDDAELDPYEFRVLLHYYRVGNCWEGTRKTAERCGISRTKVAEARISLEAKGFITIEENTNGVTINVIDKSRENVDRYSPSGGLPGGRKRSVTRTPPGLRGGHKNNPVKNTKEELIEPDGSDINKPYSDMKPGPNEPSLFTNEQAPQTVVAEVVDPEKDAFPLMVDVWCKLHPDRKFKPVDGRKIKDIREKVIHNLKANGRTDYTADNIAGMFAWYVTNPNLPPFLKGATLSVLDSQFDKAVFDLKNGVKKDDWYSQTSANRHFGKYAQ